MKIDLDGIIPDSVLNPPNIKEPEDYIEELDDN